MLQLAREGDLQALRFLAERLVPEGRPLDDVFEGVAPEPEARLASLVDHVGRGTLSPGEAEEVARIVKAHADAELWAKLRDRLAALEAKPVGAAADALVTVEPRIVDEIAAARAAAAGDEWDERLDR